MNIVFQEEAPVVAAKQLSKGLGKVFKHFRAVEKVYFSKIFYKKGLHRRTGLEIFWGGGRTRICQIRAEGARTSRGVRGHAPRKVLKNTVSLMPFPAWSKWQMKRKY